MPTYEYACGACGHGFEEFQSITAPTRRKCPACGKHKLRRLIGTGSAVIFKGSGFYQTDYRSESYKQGANADKKSPAKSDPSGSSTGDKSSSSDSKTTSNKSDD